MSIIVAVDASIFGPDAVILHRFPGTTEKAITHVSRMLTSEEKKKNQMKKEAVVLNLTVLIRLKTYFSNTSQPSAGTPAHSANRLQSWALVLLG